MNDKRAEVELLSKNKKINVDIAYIVDANKDLSNSEMSMNQSRNDSVMNTPRGYGIKTPAYYPQSPSAQNITSPKWNPNATRNN